VTATTTWLPGGTSVASAAGVTVKATGSSEGEDDADPPGCRQAAWCDDPQPARVAPAATPAAVAMAFRRLIIFPPRCPGRPGTEGRCTAAGRRHA
jgi:hypothetical protein